MHTPANRKEKAPNLDLALPIEFIEGKDFNSSERLDHFLDPAPGLDRISISPKKKKKRLTPPPGIPDLFACLYETELLTPEQEYHLFRKMNYLRFLGEQARNEYEQTLKQKQTSITSSNLEHLQQEVAMYLERALKVRNHIVTANLRLVISIAKKLVDLNNPLEDLFSQGNVPLIRAVEIFDFERGTRFSTYATWAVRNHLYRVSGKSRRHSQAFVTGDTGFFEGCSDTRSSRTYSESSQTDVYQHLAAIIDRLSERDQSIVHQRFRLFDPDAAPQTFREIGNSLGISTERVRQLLYRSLEKLETYMEEKDFELRA